MPFTGGNEFKVNQEIDLTQTTSSTNTFLNDERPMQSIAVDDAGNIVVTWSSFGQDIPEEGDWGVYARRYDAATAQWGSEFLVSRDSPVAGDQRSGSQLASAVVMDDDGDFVITWSSYSNYQDDLGGFGIYAQRYDKAGTVVGNPFRINSTTLSDQTDAAVAMDADGDFVVTWTSRNQDSPGSRGIYARRYNRDGTPKDTADILVNTYTTNDQVHSSIAMDASGNFVVVWESDGQPGDESWGIYGQRFNADGTPSGTEFRINTYTTSTQKYASVSMDATGNFVVTWTSNRGTLSGAEVYARRYNSSGVALGDEFLVNQTSSGTQRFSNVKMLKTGGFIITWTGVDSSGTGVWARRYGANGLPLSGADGDEFLINQTPAGNQGFSAVGADADGDFSVAWASGQDGSDDVFSRSFTVTPSANNPPTDILLSSSTIAENVADNSLVGTFSSVDPDGDTAFSYELVAGTGSTDNSAFTIVNNELRIVNSPDFEAQSTYAIRVKTTDPGGLSFEKPLSITISNLNEAPTDIAISQNTVNENVVAGTVVGRFSTFDPDANNTFVYSLVAGVGSTDNGLFTVVGNELRISAPPNFEAKPSYSIRVQSSDQNGLTVQKQLAINVRDVNEIPTDITISADNINENVPANSVVGSFSTVDPDAGDTFTYALVAGAGSTDNSAFTIVNNQLRINSSPDFEAKPSYSIRVRSTDKAGLIFDKVFAIKINDLNDPPTNLAPTDLGLTPSSVNENVPASTAVGTLSTVDPNAGNTFTYTLVAGAGDTDNSAFTIVGNQLRVIASPDFETKPSYTIRIRTTDQGGLSFEKAIAITINNVNEVPTDIILAPDNINENVPAGALVGQLSTLDADQSETFAYTLVAGAGSTDNAAFTLSADGKLTINASPNFELKPSYAIRVKVTDKAGASLEKQLVVNINDLPDVDGSPTDLTLSNREINENSPVNSLIGTLITTDNSTGPFTYTLDPTFGDGADFTLSGNQLILKPSPNFEAKPEYNIRVRTTDPDGLSLTKTLEIIVKDVNEPPVDLGLSATIIDENKPANSVVGTFTTTDPDANETFTYTLVAGAGSTDNAAFTITGNQLRLINAPNFEAKPTYAIRVRTTDKNGLSFDKALTITVRNVGETPTDIALSATSIDENKPANSVVGTLSTTDPDAGDTFTYSLVAGTGSTDNAAFTITGNQLQIRNAPNFETKPSYSIRVRSTDRDGLFFDKVFVVTVNDINETPIDLSLSATSIDENKPANSAVGTFSTIDSDTGETFTYALVTGAGSTDNSAFTLVGNELRINAIPDFETKPSYAIRVKTTDSKGLSIEKTFTITVNNLPETPGTNAPRDLRLSNSQIDENKPVNSVVGTLSTIDPDAGDTFTYALVAGAGSTDNAAFAIVNNELRINQIPNFETKPVYSVRIRTTDQGGLTFEKAFTIAVTNLPETPGTTVPQDLLLSNNRIDENKPANSAIGTFSTTDPDVGDTFTYELVAGAGSTDNSAFTLVGNELRINSIPDFETKASYAIRVRTRDVGGLTFEKAFTITVNNLPETPGTTPPRDLLLSSSRIDENKPANSVVGTFSTTDPDQGDTFTYELVAGAGSTDNAAFTIVNNELRINGIPNFEAKASYAIRVRTRDAGNLSFEKIFTINVNDLPETPGTSVPQDLLLSNSRIDENRPGNSVIGTFSTTDPDQGDTFTYELAAGAGSTDNAAFTIVNNQLRIKNSPDFEAKPSYSIRVRTKDSGGLAFEKVFTISVNDLPERPGDTAPTDLLLSKTTVDENVPANTLVGTLSTVDPDIGDTFTYTLEPGFGDNAAFRIVGNELRINTSPDFETKPSYSIRVVTTDSGGRTLAKTLTVGVNNQNDPPLVTPSAGSLVYRELAGEVAIDTGIRITDIDSTELEGGTVRIVGYVPGQDRLRLTPQTGISANFDAATGILTLTGKASLANYQAALRAITYSNSSTNPSTATRTIQFSVRDAFSTSNLAPRAIQITALDTAPIVTTSSGSLAYTEDSGEVAIDAGIGVTDVDSSELTGATIQLLGYRADQDQLLVTTQNGISSNFDAATGTLTLAGNAPVASYQAVLRSVSYLNTSGNPNTAPRTVQFSVRDNTATSNLATRTIQVIPVASPPVVTASRGSLSYREQAGRVAIDPLLTVADADSQTLTSATVRLQGYVAGQDTLAAIPQSGISSNFDAATGVLSLTGTAAVTAYQAVLRSVTYGNSSDAPNPSRIAQFSVRDDAANSNLATRAIQILPVNDAPTLKTSAPAITFSSGSALIDPKLTVGDIDSATLTGATVTIGNYVIGEDNLLFKDQNGITGKFNVATGVLQLTGSAPVISYQSALRSVQYGNNRAIPTGTPRLLSLQVTDGAATSDGATGRVEVRFALTGTVPTVDLNGTGVGVDYSNTFVVSGPPIAIVASDARFTNQNYPVLTSAQVTISNLLDGTSETLSADTTGMGITARYDTAGVLNLEGRASLADYLQVLRSVKYENTDATIDTTTRTILFTVSNGNSRSEPAQTTVQISQIKLVDGTQGTDGSLVTTPATDLIDASESDDAVVSIWANLQQNDRIRGGNGRDTFTLLDGSGSATVDVDNPNNQMGGIFTNNTTVMGFEVFQLTGFAGTATLFGSDLRDDTLVSGLGNDLVMGKAGNDVLGGNAGNDQLDGGTGADLLEGGVGDDLYVIDSAGDLVIEGLNAGFDTVQSSVSVTLGNNLEALTLTGSALAGTGNSLDNLMTGTAFRNRLLGAAGNDRLVGEAGQDTLNGGIGNDRLEGGQGRDQLLGKKGKDTFVLTSARKNSKDTIRDFRAADDTIAIVRNGFSRTLKLGKIRANQFHLGSQAQDASDRLIYNRSSGALFFDADGAGGIGQVQIARLSNRATLNRLDIVIINGNG